MEDLRGLLDNSIVYTRGVSTRQMYLAIGVAVVLSVVVSVVAMRFMFPGGESQPLPVAVAVSPTAIPTIQATPTATVVPTLTAIPTTVPTPTPRVIIVVATPTRVVVPPTPIPTPVPTTGNIRILALLDGQPFPGVKVETHYGWTDYTKADGSVLFTEFPAGIVGLNIDAPLSKRPELKVAGSHSLTANVKAGTTTNYTYRFQRR